jgi:hypothetical protein
MRSRSAASIAGSEYHDQGFVSATRTLTFGGRAADGDNVRRILLACLLLAGALAGTARAGQGLLVGVADDTLKWSDKPTAQRALT